MITIELTKPQATLLQDVILGHIYDLQYNKQQIEERDDLTEKDRSIALDTTISDLTVLDNIYDKISEEIEKE